MASNAAVAAIGSSPDNHIPPLKRHMRAVIARLLDAEVNVHAYWQKRLRHPLLDWYFLHTAALGNHIFFLLISPTLFFCGFGHLARLLVYVIMTTVWMSGIAKDYICMPRPKSPPIARLTKVSSHSQEYGFPSSHTTYAVAVSSTLTTALNLANNAGYISDAQWTAGAMCLALFWTTISFGRLYCGMHSMTDVGGGAFMGVIIWYFWDRMFASVDSLSIVTGSWLSISLVALAVIGLLLMHPIPDNLCPCYEDSFCATGAMLGTFLGTELYGYVFDEMDHPTDIATVPFSYEELGFVLTVVRIVFGLALVVLWRAAAKAALTPLFRAAYRVVGRWIGREKEVERLIHIKHCKHTANDSTQNGNGKAAAETAATAATAASDVSTPTELMYSVANLVRIPVYMGIGVIATFGAPVMFEIVGLGLS
ncbi:hypothetical protein GQ42DRAFT_124749 [Ramicandelaber brevisporus]|nr:hypothetical protein GQ42DRAFT_124749 [Ramicandelaber brevisporus]